MIEVGAGPRPFLTSRKPSNPFQGPLLEQVSHVRGDHSDGCQLSALCRPPPARRYPGRAARGAISKRSNGTLWIERHRSRLSRMRGSRRQLAAIGGDMKTRQVRRVVDAVRDATWMPERESLPRWTIGKSVAIADEMRSATAHAALVPGPEAGRRPDGTEGPRSATAEHRLTRADDELDRDVSTLIQGFGAALPAAVPRRAGRSPPGEPPSGIRCG